MVFDKLRVVNETERERYSGKVERWKGGRREER